MGDADWGIDSEPGTFSGVFDARFHPTRSDDVNELPSVQEARKHGFEPAHEAPLWVFIPAIWPATHRTWVYDTRIRHSRTMTAAGQPLSVPWSTADYFEIEADLNSLLVDCGLPPRPSGRVWLLRPPPGFGTLNATLDWLSNAADAKGIPIMACRAFAEAVKADLHQAFDHHA